MLTQKPHLKWSKFPVRSVQASWQTLKPKLRLKASKVETLLTMGQAVETIIEASKNGNFDLIVIGSGTGIPSARRGSPSLVIMSESTQVLIDSGPGALRRLVEAGVNYLDVDLILYTHIHPDHVSDLVPILFACKYEDAPRQKELRCMGGPGFQLYFDQIRNVHINASNLKGLDVKIANISAESSLGTLSGKETVTVPFTVQELVSMGLYPYDIPPSMTAEEALELVGLSDKAGAHLSDLSGGERRRTFIAMTLVQGAGLLLLDEPLAGMNRDEKEDIARFVLDISSRSYIYRQAFHILHHCRLKLKYTYPRDKV
jgi:ABC-type dipeptide/oligopeptide/nickel transport system ATPase component